MRLLPRFLADRRGVAAAEMALVLPAVAFIVLNVADLGLYIFARMQVDLAAQAAVGAARVQCDTPAELPISNCSGLSTTMTNAAQTTSLGSAVTLGTPTDAKYCANTSGELRAPIPANAATCSGVVTGSTSKPGDYIRVTASYTFAPIFPGASVASYLESSIQRTAWIRLQ